ncbi:MAG: alpha/beta fold hydrolase [Acidimicrobiales bacterium]
MPDVGRLAVAEGVSLHALVWEGGSGRAFLLVHGLSSNCRTWEAVAERLHAAGHPVVAVDLRGHGLSDKPANGYDFATLTRDLRLVIAAFEFGEAVAVGQSTGGNLAVELAYRASGLVAGAVGIDGGAIELSERWPRWGDCEAALAPPAFAGTPVANIEGWIRRAHRDWPDAGVAATLANLEVLPDGTARPWLTYDRHIRLLRALWEHHPSEVVPHLTVPLMLVHAEHDGNGGAAPPHAVLTGAKVRVERVRGDHDLHVQQPDRVADLLLDFAS